MLSVARAFDGLPVEISLAAFILALVLVSCFWTRNKPHLRNIPGPRLASFSNLWKIAGVLNQDMPWRNIEVHEKYGPLVRIGPNHVSTSDPEALKVIYGFVNIFKKVGSLASGLKLQHSYSIKPNAANFICTVSLLHNRRGLV